MNNQNFIVGLIRWLRGRCPRCKTRTPAPGPYGPLPIKSECQVCDGAIFIESIAVWNRFEEWRKA